MTTHTHIIKPCRRLDSNMSYVTYLIHITILGILTFINKDRSRNERQNKNMLFLIKYIFYSTSCYN